MLRHSNNEITMTKRQFESLHLRYSEVHNCPYCGKEIRVAVGPLCTIEGLYRTDQTIDTQEAEKALKAQESARAIEKAEKDREFPY